MSTGSIHPISIPEGLGDGSWQRPGRPRERMARWLEYCVCGLLGMGLLLVASNLVVMRSGGNSAPYNHADTKSDLSPVLSKYLQQQAETSKQMADTLGKLSTELNLLRRGLYLGLNAQYQERLLHDAAGVGEAEVVRALLASGAGAHINSVRKDKSPLIRAAEKGHLSTARVLLAHGARAVVNIPGGMTTTAVHVAAGAGHSAMLRLLLSHSIDVNLRDGQQSTALQYAAANGQLESVGVLLSRGVDVNSRDSWGSCALHDAAQNGHAEVAERLLRAGANINAKDNYPSFTPLIYAAKNSHHEVVTLLLKNQADIRIKDKSGRTALQHASSQPIRDVLSEAVAALE